MPDRRKGVYAARAIDASQGVSARREGRRALPAFVILIETNGKAIW